MRSRQELIDQLAYLERENARLKSARERQEKTAGINSRLLKKTNDQLQAALALAEQASRAKTDFLANISHEIRTPLNIVLGMGEALAETCLDPSQQQQLTVLRQSGRQLVDILNHVLEFSRIDSGRLDVVERPFSLSRLCGELLATVQPLARAKGLELTLTDQVRDTACRIGDPVKIRQILINILNNAVKYTETGAIRFSLDPSDRLTEPPGIAFTVTDTGIGIRPEDTRLIFDRFSQIDPSNSGKQGSVGLGLAICRKLVEAMEGSITVRSRPGRGSVFRVDLPLPLSREIPADPEVASGLDPQVDPGADPAPVTLPPMRVLVAEDIEENLFVVHHYLADHALTFSHAGNGIEALHALYTREFDLILMDIRMPLMDGAAALKEIRKKRAYGPCNIPVIAMTAHAFAEQHQDYLAQGFDAVLAKPFSREQLLAVLARHGPDSIAGCPPRPGEASRSRGYDLNAIPAEVRPMVGAVLLKLKTLTGQLKQALEQEDRGAASELCHSARGVAGMYRMDFLATLLETVSGAVKQGRFQNAGRMLPYAENHLDRLETTIQP